MRLLAAVPVAQQTGGTAMIILKTAQLFALLQFTPVATSPGLPYILGDRLSVSTIRISEIITIQRLTGTSYMKFGQHVRVLSVQDFSKGERGMHYGDRRPGGAGGI